MEQMTIPITVPKTTIERIWTWLQSSLVFLLGIQGYFPGKAGNKNKTFVIWSYKMLRTFDDRITSNVMDTKLRSMEKLHSSIQVFKNSHNLMLGCTNNEVNHV